MTPSGVRHGDASKCKQQRRLVRKVTHVASVRIRSPARTASNSGCRARIDPGKLRPGCVRPVAPRPGRAAHSTQRFAEGSGGARRSSQGRRVRYQSAPQRSGRTLRGWCGPSWLLSQAQVSASPGASLSCGPRARDIDAHPQGVREHKEESAASATHRMRPTPQATSAEVGSLRLG